MARPQPAAAIADLGVGQSEPHEEGHGDGHDIGRSEGLEPDGYLLSVLSEAVAAVEGAGIPYVLMGGIGSAAFGRPRSTHDIDFFVRPESARPVLEALAAAGFDTEERDPRWLFKGYKHDMLVDVIFRSSGDIYLDEEMLARSTVESFGSCRARVIPPEDLVVIKAVTRRRARASSLVRRTRAHRRWRARLGLPGEPGPPSRDETCALPAALRHVRRPGRPVAAREGALRRCGRGVTGPRARTPPRGHDDDR